jgi:hypothetical protein
MGVCAMALDDPAIPDDAGIGIDSSPSIASKGLCAPLEAPKPSWICAP